MSTNEKVSQVLELFQVGVAMVKCRCDCWEEG
jgi:hypothetical protein